MLDYRSNWLFTAVSNFCKDKYIQNLSLTILKIIKNR
ncbi:hypothetical protein PESP_a6002 [Pseudoalteromonas espejiana DSM 9414]|nr:hypothetical protein PESP_a6002 [Pseudoalteromonas espejiana DSM 9414]